MFARLALIHVLQLASKAGASLSGESMRIGCSGFITAVMCSANTDVEFFTRPLFLQNIRSAFTDPKSIEIGNADVAANVLGRAAKVPSFSFSRVVLSRRQIELRPGCIRFLCVCPRNRRAPRASLV
jgi:hypothetical protein